MKKQLISSYYSSVEKSYLYKDYLSVLDEYLSLGIKINPRLWFSTEWFCPDGIEGIGVPFYLKSKKLIHGLKIYGINIEGGNSSERRRLFRHELAHVVDNVYGLRKLKKRQKIFGISSKIYPNHFYPKTTLAKKRKISHIDSYYWQSHPCEDFAETLSFVVENWSNIHEFSSDLKVNYIKELILDGRTFSKKRKLTLPKVEIDSIENDHREISAFIDDYFSTKNLDSNLFNNKGSCDLRFLDLENSTWKENRPWVLDNLRQIIAYQNNYLGLPTKVTKSTMKMIEKGEESFIKKVGLNKVYM